MDNFKFKGSNCKNRVVTAIGEGTAIIKATSADGNKTATCNVTVNPFLGNTEGNITNGGMAVKQDDWIYYCEYDASANYPGAPNNSSIWKMRSNGSNKTKLINVEASYLNIKGDWIYYINDSDSKNI